jgi:hypothetical protein
MLRNDLSLRPKISYYHPRSRGEIRKYYFLKASCQPKKISYLLVYLLLELSFILLVTTRTTERVLLAMNIIAKSHGRCLNN